MCRSLLVWSLEKKEIIAKLRCQSDTGSITVLTVDWYRGKSGDDFHTKGFLANN